MAQLLQNRLLVDQGKHGVVKEIDKHQDKWTNNCQTLPIILKVIKQIDNGQKKLETIEHIGKEQKVLRQLNRYQGGVKNIKVGICKSLGQILNHVTALISEQFSESRSDDSSCAKSDKRILQKYPILQWENGQNKPENQQN